MCCSFHVLFAVSFPNRTPSTKARISYSDAFVSRVPPGSTLTPRHMQQEEEHRDVHTGAASPESDANAEADAVEVPMNHMTYIFLVYFFLFLFHLPSMACAQICVLIFVFFQLLLLLLSLQLDRPSSRCTMGFPAKIGTRPTRRACYARRLPIS